MSTSWDSQRIARTVLIVAVVLLSVFMLWRFLPALAWAGVLAIASWPLRDTLARRGMGKTSIAALLTVAFAVLLVLPLIRLGIEAADLSGAALQSVRDVRLNGLATPDWVAHLPYVGDKAAAWWQANLATPSAAGALFDRFKPTGIFDLTRALGVEVADRLTILVFSLLALFFLYRDGPSAIAQGQTIVDRLFGPLGWQIGQNAVVAVRGTVNGLVLVGLLEGVLLGVAYLIAGLPHAALLGLATGVFAAIPFGAAVIYVVCALVLLVRAQTTAAVALVVFGSLVGLAADHLVRPSLIGKSARLPFLWALLGIFGGLETFGLVGLFLGPAIMSVLVAIWRKGAT